MLPVQAKIDSLSNFVTPLYETVLCNSGDTLLAKKETVEILLSTMRKYYVDNNSNVDLYVVSPLIREIELVVGTRIKSIPINKNTPKEVRDLLEFYKSLLISMHKFYELSVKVKKE